MPGSSHLDLLDQTAESLTGRNEKLQLPPLTFQEALRVQEWCSDAYTPAVLRERFSALAHQVGNEVSVHELAMQVKMARPTVER